MPDELAPEDAKIVTLARSARARTGAPEGAAVRDQDGRTYSAATVDLASLQVSALGVAVAMAVSSGARSLEAAALNSDGSDVPDGDLAAVRDLAGDGVPVYLTDRRGQVVSRVTT